MDKLAIDAVFVDYRRVKGRKCHQIVFEVPSEKWPEVYRVLGEPTIETSDWWAIAKMNGVAPEKSKGGKLAQKAGILCNEKAFQRFIAEVGRWGMAFTLSDEAPEAIAAHFIYERCGVSSRAHLDHDDEAAKAFRDLEIEYRNWLNGISPDPGAPAPGHDGTAPLAVSTAPAGSRTPAGALSQEKA